MKLKYEHDRDRLRVRIFDEIDHHCARQIIDELDSLTALYVVESFLLDLSGVTFMDSSGLAVVINLYRALSKTGRSLTIIGTPPQPMRVFKAAGFDKIVVFAKEEG